MSLDTATVEIKGTVPLIMHNGALCDPLNETVQAMKKLTSKPPKSKTDDDYYALRDLEWMGGLYLDEQGYPIIPSDNIEAAIREGARASRKGKDVERAVMVDADARVAYKGPKNAEKLMANPGFVDRRRVVIKKAAVMRTRPIFREWSLKFTVSFRPDLVNKRDLQSWLVHAGRVTGIGDHRPKFGRFEVTKFE